MCARVVSVCLLAFVLFNAASSLARDHEAVCAVVHPPEYAFKPLLLGTRRSKRAVAETPRPLRITAVYDSLFYSLHNSAYVQTLVEQAINYFEKALLVRRPSNAPLAIPRQRSCAKCVSACQKDCTAKVQCLHVEVPEQFCEPCNVCSDGHVTASVGGPGANETDFLLFVSAAQSGCAASSIAYATTCLFDQRTWRPTAGIINLCSIVNQDGLLHYDPEKTVALLRHELTHALGFTSASLALFVDDQGKPLSPLDPKTRLPRSLPSGKYVWGDKVAVTKTVLWKTATGYVPVNKTYVVTPKVQQYVRDFFNCSSLIGAELEDQGGQGMELSHWEKRLFVGEYMVGVSRETARISALTLALLHDSGWYFANFSMAEPFTWGQGLGCKYASGSCLEWIESQTATGRSAYPFCNQFDMQESEVRTVCDAQQQSVRVCNLVAFTQPVSPAHAYFKRKLANAPISLHPSHYAGRESIADFCPYFEELELKVSGQRLYKTCTNEYSNPSSGSNFALETHSAISLCLRQSRASVLYQCNAHTKPVRWGSGCYPVTCSDEGVTVRVDEQLLKCTKELQEVTWTPKVTNLNVSRFLYSPTLVTGSLLCPLCRNACPNKPCRMIRVAAGNSSLALQQNENKATATFRYPPDVPCGNTYVPRGIKPSPTRPSSTKRGTSLRTTKITTQKTSALPNLRTRRVRQQRTTNLTKS